jgi:chromosome segregation ATPase
MGLDAWRLNWIQHQVNDTSHQLALAAQATFAESEKAAMLEKRLSSLNLRTGLLSNEKKASDAQALQAQQQIAVLENTLEQMKISQRATVNELEKRLTNSNSKRHEADMRAKEEIERATEAHQKFRAAEDSLRSEAEKVKQLTAANAQLKESNQACKSEHSTLHEDLGKLLVQYNLALNDLADKEQHLVSANSTIAKLQRKEHESLLNHQRDRFAHVRELKEAEERFKTYKESVEVSTLPIF